jgi:hypothetical protein
MGNNANPVAWSHARIWLAASGRPDRTADLEDSLGTLPDRCDNYRTWCHESIGGHHVVARRRCRLERSSQGDGIAIRPWPAALGWTAELERTLLFDVTVVT